MYSTPSGERIHIGIFGRRNAGKSSLLNAISAQSSAIVSDMPGTTTDPVRRVMEILPLGPVVIIDTPGLDDTGALGKLRVEQAQKVLGQVDIALVVLDKKRAPEALEEKLLMALVEKKVPCICVYNKADVWENPDTGQKARTENLFLDAGEVQEEASLLPVFCSGVREISVSAKTGFHIHELKELLAEMAPEAKKEKPLISDLITAGDTVVLVTPIDSAAPKGRLILPQQMALREVLDCHCLALTVQDTELLEAFSALSVTPSLVVTDSQVFGKVMKLVPEDVPLTSFSILLARKKGSLQELVQGAYQLDRLADGDRLLICEGCTHHRQCDDIGTVKLPAWIKKHSGKSLAFEFTSGGDFPTDLSSYALVVHCGGCMLNDKEIAARQRQAQAQDIPMTNYGTAIAHMNGILERSLAVFG